MQSNQIDVDKEIGKKYGRWTVVKFSHKKKWRKFFICKCECGTTKTLDITSLRCGNSKSCGCLRNEKIKARSIKHGLSSSRLNRIYRNMKTRCYNVNAPIYQHYGAKGIKICDEWLGKNGFDHFHEWSIKNGYTDNLTIDRKDSTGNYEPSNCRWVTPKVQANNINTNVYLEYKGECHTIAEWSDILDIKRTTISERKRKGYPIEDILYQGYFKTGVRNGIKRK